jgi:hypothetical protein
MVAKIKSAISSFFSFLGTLLKGFAETDFLDDLLDLIGDILDNWHHHD